MSETRDIPRAARAFVDFVALLRAHEFAVAPDQTTSFLAAIGLLGPRSMQDIRQAGLATLAPPPERRAAYDALFRLHFLGGEALPAEGDSEETLRIQDDARGQDAPLSADEINESGQTAARAELLVERRFERVVGSEPLRRLAREARRRLPLRRGHRRVRARRGPFADLRRTLRESARNDGEFLKLSRLRRRPRARKLLVLIDVSGSMKQRTDENLALAHVLTQSTPLVETFTFGTRLTRVTRALRLKRREQALSAAARLVGDWDGGTRIGEALQAFLAVPRFAGYARGAAVLVISDGLERGDVGAMRDAAAKLSRRAWVFHWLTPLATTRAFTPQTAGLLAIRPFVDEMVNGGSTEAIVAHILSLRRRRAA